MSTRTLLRCGLVLLLLAGQLVAVRGVTGAGQARSSQQYSCCCVGECHCTTDCCNHPPHRSADELRPSLRKAAELPHLQSSKSCGGWQGTLSRSSGGSSVDSLERIIVLDAPALGRQPLLQIWSTRLDGRALLRRLAPRAPPVLPTRAAVA